MIRTFFFWRDGKRLFKIRKISGEENFLFLAAKLNFEIFSLLRLRKFLLMNWKRRFEARGRNLGEKFNLADSKREFCGNHSNGNSTRSAHGSFGR